jgi:hypothetical protein
MPLLDHFHPPLTPHRHWESFHSTWASSIADALTEDLPEPYFAEELVHAGACVEIDVATFSGDAAPRVTGSVATAPPRVWFPPAPAWSIPAAFPDQFEIRVYDAEGGHRLVAAIELVSPSNKDRDSHRQAFAAKCAGYLAQGVSLVTVDIVTSRPGVPHNDVMQLLGQPPARVAEDALTAAAYRPIVRGGEPQIDVWLETMRLGGPLPTVPLSLSADLCLPLDLEATYAMACERRRLN